MVQSLARALPSTSRVVQPSTQPSRPVRAPTPTPQRPTLTLVEAARVALPPLPPTQRPALPPTQAVRDAHQQSTPVPRRPQALAPTAVLPLTAAVAPAIPVISTLPASPMATLPSRMVTIGKLTAERLCDVDRESVQLPCDMVPSAYYVVDALGRRGTKSHNHVLSQWGHVSTGGKGEHISLKRVEGRSALLCFSMGMTCCAAINCSHIAFVLKLEGLDSFDLPATRKCSSFVLLLKSKQVMMIHMSSEATASCHNSLYDVGIWVLPSRAPLVHAMLLLCSLSICLHNSADNETECILGDGTACLPQPSSVSSHVCATLVLIV